MDDVLDTSTAASEDSSLWWLGVLMSIISSILSNLVSPACLAPGRRQHTTDARSAQGVNIEKFALMREEARAKLAAARRVAAGRLPRLDSVVRCCQSSFEPPCFKGAPS